MYYRRAHVRRLFHRLDGWIVMRIWSWRFKRWRNAGWKRLPRSRLYGEYGPAVRDRVVQAAVKIVLEPVYEADFLPCAFGFRPKRSVHDALQVLIDECWQGRRWVVETDIANCFSAIPHEWLMQAIEERISDQGVLKLLRAMLRAGVMEDGQLRREVTGTAQGGPASPLLCNIYLHRLDREWNVGRHGVLVRYCDDLVVLCRSRQPSASTPSKPGSRSPGSPWKTSACCCAGTAPMTPSARPSPASYELISSWSTILASSR